MPSGESSQYMKMGFISLLFFFILCKKMKDSSYKNEGRLRRVSIDLRVGEEVESPNPP
jgi:hypothetical protein